jgi:alkylhydroperoxidase family enzyme
VRKGLSEDEVDAAIGDLDAAAASRLLPAKTIAALRLVDHLAVDHPTIDAEAYRQLCMDFDEGELLELATAVVIANGWQKLIEAFGIRPDHWTEATPLPWSDES